MIEQLTTVGRVPYEENICGLRTHNISKIIWIISIEVFISKFNIIYTSIVTFHKWGKYT